VGVEAFCVGGSPLKSPKRHDKAPRRSSKAEKGNNTGKQARRLV